MSPELTLIYMEWQHWMMIWKYRIENKFPDYIIFEAENRSFGLQREFETRMLAEI